MWTRSDWFGSLIRDIFSQFGQDPEKGLAFFFGKQFQQSFLIFAELIDPQIDGLHTLFGDPDVDASAVRGADRAVKHLFADEFFHRFGNRTGGKLQLFRQHFQGDALRFGAGQDINHSQNLVLAIGQFGKNVFVLKAMTHVTAVCQKQRKIQQNLPQAVVLTV